MLVSLRYGVPLLFFVAGWVILLLEPNSWGLEGWAMCEGAALAILLFNVLVRFGNSGEQERHAEEAARAYLLEHGHWPDEAPKRRAPQA